MLDRGVADVPLYIINTMNTARSIMLLESGKFEQSCQDENYSRKPLLQYGLSAM
jgi:hypothetical protein